MPRLPIVDLTDTTLAIVDIRRFCEEHPKAHKALMNWCRAHNIDPDRVPADGLITRHPATRAVSHGYVEKNNRALQEMTVVVDHDVAPWPDELVALSRVFGGRDTELENALAEIETLKAEVAKLRETVVSLRKTTVVNGL